MSIYSGAFTVTQYEQKGGRASYKTKQISECLEPFKVKALRLGGSLREVRYGWVRPLIYAVSHSQPSPADHWDGSDCQIAGGSLLRIRIEQKKIQNQLFQTILKDKITRETHRRKKELSSADKKAIKEQVRLELIEKALPSIEFIDLFWSEARRQVLVFHTSPRILQIVEDLFEKTFCAKLGFHLTRHSPGPEVEAGSVDKLAEVIPSRLSV